MGKTIAENTGWIVRTTTIAGVITLLMVWFNNRISAVEISQAEQKSDIRHILDNVVEIKATIKDAIKRP